VARRAREELSAVRTDAAAGLTSHTVDIPRRRLRREETVSSVPTLGGRGAVSHQSGGEAADQRFIGLPPVQPGIETAGRDGGVPAHLLPQQRALLDRLANGETIAAAAAAEFLSLRTANRRIAQARELLGARTTREAVLLYVRQRRQV
jgi:DNA-binding CsgD family transcriptional regulator